MATSSNNFLDFSEICTETLKELKEGKKKRTGKYVEGQKEEEQEKTEKIK